MKRLKHGHSEQTFTAPLQPTEQDNGKLVATASTANIKCSKTYIYSIFFHAPPNPGVFFLHSGYRNYLFTFHILIMSEKGTSLLKTDKKLSHTEVVL